MIMKTALIFGGTRFFGVNLVRSLLDQGIEVTIATRQQTEDPFGEEVKRLKVDRFDEDSVTKAVEGKEWDVVFDQICFSSSDAQITTNALEGKIKKYIFTSTLSVYDNGEQITEEQFDPYTYQLKMVDKEEVSYQEGKRQAEAYFFQRAPFPVVAVRIPIVLGEEDYTGRLLYYINSVKNEEPVYFPAPDASMGFIHQQEAGQFISWIASTDFKGPINACASGEISMKNLIGLIAERVKKEPIIDTENERESPYGVEQTWTVTNERASKLGYRFSKLEDWLPGLIANLV
jgi:nucleoside-diphosphate-sugar epimerase